MKQNKRIYEAPAMQVVELKSRQMLLAGSNIDDFQNGGDKWTDPEYDS